MFKIYALIHPITNKICYIGCTKQKLKKRLSQHNSPKKTNQSYVAKAKRSFGDLKFGIKLINAYRTEDEMYKAEINYIKAHKDKDYKLYNLQPGGKLNINPKRSLNKMVNTRKLRNYPSLEGENNNNAILKEEEVLEIYSMIKDFKSNSEIIDKFNLSKSHITSIRKGSLWKYLWNKYLGVYIPSIKSSVNPTKDKIEIINMMEQRHSIENIHRLYPNISKHDLHKIRDRKLWKTVWKAYEVINNNSAC